MKCVENSSTLEVREDKKSYNTVSSISNLKVCDVLSEKIRPFCKVIL